MTTTEADREPQRTPGSETGKHRSVLAPFWQPNAHHFIDDLSLAYVRKAAEQVGCLERVAEFPEIDDYSFAVVFRKTLRAGAPADGDADKQGQLVAAWRQRDELTRLVRVLESKVKAMEQSRALRLSRVVRRLIGKLRNARAARLATGQRRPTSRRCGTA